MHLGQWGRLEEEDSRRIFQRYINHFMGGTSGAKAPMSAQDKQALEWANKNPQDPRAVEIKKRLNQ